jgi:hypothetical protein
VLAPEGVLLIAGGGACVTPPGAGVPGVGANPGAPVPGVAPGVAPGEGAVVGAAEGDELGALVCAAAVAATRLIMTAVKGAIRIGASAGGVSGLVNSSRRASFPRDNCGGHHWTMRPSMLLLGRCAICPV